MQAKFSAPKDEKAKSSAYRPDIDGLRAIAILSVVVYHAFPSWLSGGFAGVDVFFVISGYLIFSIILKGLLAGTFRFSEFYAHRIKRIFPALILVVLFTYIFGWFTLFPDEFRKLGQHMLAGLGFHENFLLRRESGYFDVSSEVKPLMHLWSLAIEEQFYLIFPLVVWSCWHIGINSIVVISMFALISFSFNIVGVNKDVVSTFFMPHTRFWELLAGAMLAYFTINSGVFCAYIAKIFSKFPRLVDNYASRSSVYKDVSSVVGLLLLLVNFFVLKQDYLFPGWWALVSVLGAVLLILSGPDALVNNLILSNRVMVFIGLISYPLYLWHWPILTFSRILQPGTPSVLFNTMCLGLSVLLAWLTYRLLERPIRFGANTWMKTASLCVIALIVGVIGRVSYKQDGLEFRSVVTKNHLATSTTKLQSYQVPGCGLSEEDSKEFLMCSSDSRGKSKFALIGDSKASALSHGILGYENPHGYWRAVGGNGRSGATVPVVSNAPMYKKYQDLARLTLESVGNDPDIKVVAIVTAARALFQLEVDYSIEEIPTSPNAGMVLDGLDNMVISLIGAGKKVVLVVDNPTLKDPKKCVPRVTSFQVLDRVFGLGEETACSISYDRQMELSAAYRKILSEIQNRHPESVRIFDVMDILCNMETRICEIASNGKLLYSYSDHVSIYSSALIAEKLVPFVERFSAEPLVSTER